MTVDEFLARAEDQEGRHELFMGKSHGWRPSGRDTQEPEYVVETALLQGIRKAGTAGAICFPMGTTCGSDTLDRASAGRARSLWTRTAR